MLMKKKNVTFTLRIIFSSEFLPRYFRFAVKLLDWGEDGMGKVDEIRASFKQEVSVWQTLDHPNVTRVYIQDPNLFILLYMIIS